jgi:hypothetical protein
MNTVACSGVPDRNLCVVRQRDLQVILIKATSANEGKKKATAAGVDLASDG